MLLLFFQVRAEDADVLVTLVYHCSCTNHPLFLPTSNGYYGYEKLSLKNRGATCSQFHLSQTIGRAHFCNFSLHFLFTRY